MSQGAHCTLGLLWVMPSTRLGPGWCWAVERRAAVFRVLRRQAGRRPQGGRAAGLGGQGQHCPVINHRHRADHGTGRAAAPQRYHKAAGEGAGLQNCCRI